MDVVPDMSAWTPQAIADAWNSINDRDRFIGTGLITLAFIRWAIVPLVSAWRRR